jgi:hypothetical protein
MRKNLLLALVLFCSSIAAFAQSKISGKVTSADDGSGIPGVTVQIKGTSKGTQTDLNGGYEIEASAGQTLVYSFVGMVSQEVAVGTKSIINVVLASDAKALSEERIDPDLALRVLIRCLRAGRLRPAASRSPRRPGSPGSPLPCR